jgi:hypothetical protein
MTKSMIIFFFLHHNQNIFFSNIENQNIFFFYLRYLFSHSHHTPLQVKWSVPYLIKDNYNLGRQNYYINLLSGYLILIKLVMNYIIIPYPKVMKIKHVLSPIEILKSTLKRYTNYYEPSRPSIIVWSNST